MAKEELNKKKKNISSPAANKKKSNENGKRKSSSSSSAAAAASAEAAQQEAVKIETVAASFIRKLAQSMDAESANRIRGCGKDLVAHIKSIAMDLPAGALQKELRSNLPFYARLLRKEVIPEPVISETLPFSVHNSVQWNRSLDDNAHPVSPATWPLVLHQQSCPEATQFAFVSTKESNGISNADRAALAAFGSDNESVQVAAFLSEISSEVDKLASSSSAKADNEKRAQAVEKKLEQLLSRLALVIPSSSLGGAKHKTPSSPHQQQIAAILGVAVKNLTAESPVAALVAKALQVIHLLGAKSRIPELALALLGDSPSDLADAVLAPKVNIQHLPTAFYLACLEKTRPSSLSVADDRLLIRHLLLLSYRAAKGAAASTAAADKMEAVAGECQHVQPSATLLAAAHAKNVHKLLAKSTTELRHVQKVLEHEEDVEAGKAIQSVSEEELYVIDTGAKTKTTPASKKADPQLSASLSQALAAADAIGGGEESSDDDDDDESESDDDDDDDENSSSEEEEEEVAAPPPKSAEKRKSLVSTPVAKKAEKEAQSSAKKSETKKTPQQQTKKQEEQFVSDDEKEDLTSSSKKRKSVTSDSHQVLLSAVTPTNSKKRQTKNDEEAEEEVEDKKSKKSSSSNKSRDDDEEKVVVAPVRETRSRSRSPTRGSIIPPEESKKKRHNDDVAALESVDESEESGRPSKRSSRRDLEDAVVKSSSTSSSSAAAAAAAKSSSRRSTRAAAGDDSFDVPLSQASDASSVVPSQLAMSQDSTLGDANVDPEDIDAWKKEMESGELQKHTVVQLSTILKKLGHRPKAGMRKQQLVEEIEQLLS